MRYIILSFGLLGCEDKLSDVVASSGNGWSSNVEQIDATDSVVGNLSDGMILDHLDWADNSSVACWPGNEHQNFTGSHVFYATDHPSYTYLTATVTPNSEDVDVNVYVLQQTLDSYQEPPDVGGVVSCEVGFPMSTDSNPGEEDSATVTSIEREYNVLIGVAGPEGVTSGEYTLTLSLSDFN